MAKSESGPKTPNIDSGPTVGIKYSNGAQHWYDVDEQGKKRHISEDKMLEDRGYSPRLEDYLAPTADPDEEVVDPTTGTRPGEIGGVDIGVGREDDSEDDDALPGRGKRVTIIKRDRDRGEAGLTDTERAYKLDKLLKRMNALTDAAVEFEKSGKNEHKETAFWMFAELFDEMAELEGWEEDQRDAYLKEWVLLVEAMLLKDDPDKTDDPDKDDPDEDKAKKAIEESPRLKRLKHDLDKARDRLARLNAQASGRIFVGRKLRAELEEANSIWQQLQVQAGVEAMNYISQVEGDELDEDKMSEWASLGSAHEANQLRDLQAAYSDAGPDSGFIRKFMHRYAKNYNKAGRIKKMLLLAPAGLVIGVSAGAVIGAVGGGIMAGLVARSAVRSALTAKMQALRAKDGADLQANPYDFDLDDVDEAMRSEVLALQAASFNRLASEETVAENTRSNKKRAGVAIGLGSIVGLASGAVANWATDQDWFKGSGVGGKLTGQDPFGGQRPSGGGVVEVIEPRPPIVVPTEGVGTEQLESMTRLFNAEGKYPWNRAMDFFDGDARQSSNWLQEAVRRTPGAKWHHPSGSLGPKSWISVNGVSKTDAVWSALTKGMLTPPST